MVYTMITSKLDYCNAILCGLPESTIEHLTRVQNLSARFIWTHNSSSFSFFFFFFLSWKEQGLMATTTWWSPPSSISPLEKDQWAMGDLNYGIPYRKNWRHARTSTLQRNCLRHFYLKRPTCSSYIHNVHFCFVFVLFCFFYLFIYLFIPLFFTFNIFNFVNTYFLFMYFFDFLFSRLWSTIEWYIYSAI